MARENEVIKQIEKKFIGSSLAVLLAAVVTTGAMLSGARAVAQANPASVHGHINNAAGVIIQNAVVKLTKDHSNDPKTLKFPYTFPEDANGDFKGTGIAPDTYTVVVTVNDTIIDYFPDLTFKAGEDKLVNFDMTRKDFIDKMTPEQKQQLEEYKKKTAAALAANSKIANLNGLLQQARADIKAGNNANAVTAMTQATTQKPDEPLLWITLGDAQLGVANDTAKTAKAAGKTATDPDVVQKYTDASVSYKKAIDLNSASKKPSPEMASDAYNQLGQTYARIGDIKNAQDAYDQAAKSEPTKAGMYYLNEAVILYNASKTDDAAIAADKAIAADPTKADAYYIKGQSLIQKVTIDPKTQKPTAPPGCLDAYQKYLELAPDGPHATEVKEILTGMGEKVKSSYKAGKKS